MKKLLYTFFVAAAGLMLASCKQEHIEVVYNPDATTVQTLGNFSETVLTEGGANLVATFTPADFIIDAAKSYVLYTSSAADMSDKSKMAAKIRVNEDESAGQVTLSQKDLNSKILSLGGEADVPFTLYFQLGASIANDKGNAIASTEVLSNIASVKLTPYNTLILDVDTYDHVWIIGASSAVGAWSFEKVHQYLYDYEKTGTTFTGLIDFGEDGPAGGFKLTGVDNWDDATKNWGSEAQAEEAEAATVQIIAGGSSKDIKCYSKRYYGFSFNSSTLVLTKLYGFDNVGIVGAFNKWNAGDANMKMSYNQDFHRFYIDYTFAEATELKFACDDSWDLNWGGKEGTTAPNGDNIAVEPGSYRIYLDVNKGTYELSTSMFGKDEPGASNSDEPGPQPIFVGWSVTGSIAAAGINWDGDIDMTTTGAFWVAREVKLAAGDQFKFRKAHDWAENIGAPGDTEPAIVEIGVKTTGAAGGKNLAVAAEGTYDLYVNPDELSFYVMTTGDVPAELASWGVVGTINGWGSSADLAMVEEDGMLVRKNVALTTGDQFKVRYMSSWDVNRGAPGDVEPFVMGTDAIAATQNGKNLGVAADGNYDIWYDELNEVLFVVPAGEKLSYWGVVGNITGWGGDRRDYIMSKSGDFYSVKGIELAEDSQFKLRYSSGWDVNRGAPGDVEPFKVDAGSVVEATQNGKNLGVNAAGKYDIWYNAAEEKLYVMAEGTDPSGAVTPEPPTPEKPTAWSIIGTIDGSGWGKDFDLTNTEGDIWKYEGLTVTASDEFKIRANHDWGTSVGGPEENEDSAIDPVSNPYKVFRPTLGTAFTAGGVNIRIAVAGTYNVTFDYAAKTILIEGAAAGSGIKTADELLAWLADGTKDAELAADIDLSGKTPAPAAEITGSLDGKGHTITVKDLATPVLPVVKGNVKDVVFAGSFAATPGAEKIILAPIGKSYGTIENVTNKASVSLDGPAGQGGADTAVGATAAGVVGEAYGPVKGCKNEASVSAAASGKDTWTIVVSGIAGFVGDAVEGCVNSGEVSLVAGSPLGRTAGMTEVTMKYNPVSSVAGVVAYAVSDPTHTVTVKDCSNSAKISFTYDNLNGSSAAVSRSPIAGIVANSGGDITNCHNTGDIYASMNSTDRSKAYSAKNIILHAAGIQGADYFVKKIKSEVDQNETSVIDCTNSGNIYVDTDMTASNNAVGGISGWPAAESPSVTVIKNCINSGNISMKGLGKIRLGGIAGGSNSIEGCKNTGNISVENADGASVFGLINGFHTQTHTLKNCEAAGKVECKVKVTGLGGLCGAIGNAANTLGEGCKVNATITGAETPQCGLILGNFNGNTKEITIGTTDSPVTVAGNVNGTEATADNFMTLLHNASNYKAEAHTFNVVFGK